MYRLIPSPRSGKKWRVITPLGKNIDFGAEGYSDLTIHKDPSRQNNYISRHQARENWTKSGIDTAGFWARWLLWNLPSLEDSIKDIENRFNITIQYNNNNNNINSNINTKSNNDNGNKNVNLNTPWQQNIQDAYLQYEQALNNALPEEIEMIYANIGISSHRRYNDLNNYIPLLYRKDSTNINEMTDFELIDLLPEHMKSQTDNFETRQSLINYVKTSLNSNNNSKNNKGDNSEYKQCLIDAQDRKNRGKLKLCPEGYCTAKLTSDVYPSYWANLKASKICSGTEEDMEGKIENHYK